MRRRVATACLRAAETMLKHLRTVVAARPSATISAIQASPSSGPSSSSLIEPKPLQRTILAIWR